jgi:hypothetical protein
MIIRSARDEGLPFPVALQGETCERIARISARFLKWMLVSVRVPIILAGEEDLETLLGHGALKRRTHGVIKLQPYPWGDYEDVKEVMGIAGMLAGHLGYPEAGVGTDVEQAMRLYYDTGGVIGLMAKRIVEAARLANAAGSKTLTAEHFSKAWREWEREQVKVIPDPLAILERKERTADGDPYLVETSQLKKLWLSRFIDVEQDDSTRLTRRRSSRGHEANRSFGAR